MRINFNKYIDTVKPFLGNYFSFGYYTILHFFSPPEKRNDLPSFSFREKLCNWF